MKPLFPNLTEQLEEEALNPDRIQRVMTLKIRGGKRHLMCGGGDILRPLCKARYVETQRKSCGLTSPDEITCRSCRRIMNQKAKACAKAEGFDLLEPGSAAILGDLLLDRGRPIDLFHRRLVLIFEGTPNFETRE